jgi:hypothetical protein
LSNFFKCVNIGLRSNEESLRKATGAKLRMGAPSTMPDATRNVTVPVPSSARESDVSESLPPIVGNQPEKLEKFGQRDRDEKKDDGKTDEGIIDEKELHKQTIEPDVVTPQLVNDLVS